MRIIYFLLMNNFKFFFKEFFFNINIIFLHMDTFNVNAKWIEIYFTFKMFLFANDSEHFLINLLL